MPSGLGLDLRYALRSARRHPGYAISAVLCLALAMGVNATLFSFLDSMYFRPLPVPDAGRLVWIHRDRTNPCTWAEYLNFRGGLRSIVPAAWLRFGAYADLDGFNQMLSIETVSANYAGVLRLGTALGRWFVPQDDSPASQPAMVISYRLWKSQFHGDPAVIGTWIRTDVQSFRVIGVAPEGFHGVAPPIADAAWVPEASLLNLGLSANSLRVNLTARLAPGATIDSARAEVQVLDFRLNAANPRDPRAREPLRVDQTSGFLWANGSRFFRPVLLLMSLVCGMVFLIACVNVANLLLARSASRRREIAVRQSLGAGRARLVRAAFAEGLLLAAGGTALGMLAGHLAGRFLEWMLPSIPMAAYQGVALGIDARVALLLALAGVLSAMLFSLPPAMAHPRGDLLAGLNGRGAMKGPRQRELYSLIQVALSLTLLIATGVLLHALESVQAADLGFARDHRLYASLTAAPDPAQPESSAALFTTLLERARALPGVRNATLSSVYFEHTRSACATRSALEAPRKLSAGVVEPGYFAMMRIPILRGRAFAAAGTAAGSAAVVITETMARTWWPGEDAIGKTLWLGCAPAGRRPGQVIGIARDSRYAELDEPPEPFYYTSRLETQENSFALILETESNPNQWAKPLMQLVESAGPRLRVGEVRSLEDAVSLSLWELKWQASLLGSLGLLAIVLAALGLYGVMSYGVTQRTREIGIRMALGAQPATVQQMVIARGLRVTAAGVAAGLILSAFSVRLLRGYLYGLSPFDPVAFGAASMLWLAIAVLASWYPARRAIRADPLKALQYE